MQTQLPIAKLVEITGGELKGNQSVMISGVASLKDAGKTDISFLGNNKYARQVKDTNAGAVIVPTNCTLEPAEDQAFVFVDIPDLAFTKAIAVFAPEPIQYKPGIHPSAVVAETAKLGDNVHIGANAVIDECVEIGNNTVIGAGTYIGHYSKVGNDCLIYANVSIRERILIGNRVIIHIGVAIGADGYGFAPTPTGIMKIPQVGIVQIDDDVEIGANTVIDRARFGKTWIKTGVKIDDLVMVAHNAVVGEHSMLIAQSGLAGSATIGKGVIMAARSGANGHITIGDGVKVAGTSGVAKDWPAGTIAVGTPAEFPQEFKERHSLPKKVKRMSNKIEELEQELAALKAKL